MARRNGQVFITGNSGFPKSLNVSKAMDKAAGVEREVVGRRTDRAATPIQDLSGQAYNTQPLNTFDGSAITAPATDLAKQWDGWGTALKPGGEDWWLVRKPLIGTVAANVERFGTGALNIAGCRIDSGEDYTALRVKQGAKDRIYGGGSGLRSTATTFDPASGRWPANVTLDESAAAALDAQSGELSASWGRSTRGRAGMFGPDGGGVAIRCSEGGGASRFYYTAKASSAERSEGVDGRNIHPTVKPVDLMRWLCRLITPPGGTIVDPFMGSGTTGVAARDEGFGFIGIERDPESFAIAEQRLAQTGMAL